MRTRLLALGIVMLLTILTVMPTVTAQDIRINPSDPIDGDAVTIKVETRGTGNVTNATIILTYNGRAHGPFNMTQDGTEWSFRTEALPDGNVNASVTLYMNTSEVSEFSFRFNVGKEGQIPIDVILLMLLMSLVIFVGFMGTYIFDKFSIPEVLSLILLGILIGAGLHLLSDDLMGLLKDVSPLVAAIALLIILFDGGINLNLDSVIKESSHASLLAILGFVITMFAIGAVAALLFFDMKILPSLMLGAALGGTSGAIVIPTVMNMDTDEDVKVLLSLESTITDVLCIVAAVAIAEVLVPTTGSTGAAGAAQSIIGAFAVGIFMGGIGGVVWLRFMPTIERMRFGFMLTIAFVFTLYALTQFAGGSGPVAALCVGLVLANGPEIGRMFRYKETASISRSMKQFQSEITFFVKSFFFVYVGLLFTFAGPEIYLYGALLAGIILLVRMATVKLTMKDMKIKDRELMTILGPRGLSAAVLATLPITYGFEEKGILTASQIEIFTNVSLIVILATVIVTTIGIPAGKKRWTTEHMEEISSARRAKREKRISNKKERRIEKEKRRIEVSKEKGGADDLILMEEEMHSRSKAADHERKEAVKALEDEIAGKIRALKEHYGARSKDLEDGEESKRKELEDELARKEKALDEELRENKRRIGEEQLSAVEAYEKELGERKKALEEDFTEKKEALRSEKEERRESLKVQAALGTALDEEGPKKRTKVETVPKRKAAARKGTDKKVVKKKMAKKE